MRLNLTIHPYLKAYFFEELESYKRELNVQNFSQAWQHLERAHVIGQASPWHHTYVHWKMLQFGFKIKSSKEILGQIPRLLVGGIKSFVGKIPVGNTGGANIPPLRPLPIQPDIQELFIKAKNM